MGDSKYYKDIIRARGFVRNFYETIKIGTEKVIQHIFITGISPIMLDDLTSGFNISANITTEQITNEMLGFSIQELEKIFDNFTDLNIKQTLPDLKLYYNGYLFNEESTKRVYNPDMVLYYLNQLVRYNRIPKKLIDENVKTDYGRLNRLISNQANRETLQEMLLLTY